MALVRGSSVKGNLHLERRPHLLVVHNAVDYFAAEIAIRW